MLCHDYEGVMLVLCTVHTPSSNVLPFIHPNFHDQMLSWVSKVTQMPKNDHSFINRS